MDNKDKIKEQKKAYKEANKDKIKAQNKAYYEAHKERRKEYLEANKDKIREQKKISNKEYYKTENGKKSNRILSWKNRGVSSDNYDDLYEKYINTKFCEECDIELIEGKTGNNRRCLDHNHISGLFRNVLCNLCNLKRK